MNKNKLLGNLACLATVMVWGATFVSSKVLLEDFSPAEILFIRFLLGWIALCAACPHRIGFLDKKTEIIFAGAGLCGVTLYFLFENMALTYTFASNVGVIVTISPLFTALLAWKILSESRPGLNFLLGFIIAMLGVVLISYNGTFYKLNPFGDFLALLAAAVWALYSIQAKYLTRLGFNSIQVTKKIFLYGLFFMLPIMFTKNFSFDAARLFKPVYFVNLLFLGLWASALCFATWTFALKTLGASRASAYIYIVPVVTMIFSNIILHEPVTLFSAAGCVLTICGLVLAELPPKADANKMAKSEGPEQF